MTIMLLAVAQGTVNASIQNCWFDRVDGTALFLNGYHRNATIAYNEV